jgi:hypothetical protein
MARKVASLFVIVALIGLIAAPVEAKKKRKPSPVAITYHLNWMGDCAGSGYLSLTATPNEGQCALYFPGLGDSYGFAGSEGTPFFLDATKAIPVDFVLIHVASVAADFEVVLEGTINGESTPIASGTQTVVAGSTVTPTPLHYDLEPDASLDKAKVTGLSLTINWTNGVTYSQIDFDAGATMVINGLK